MHTIDLLAEAVRLAEAAGFTVRQQWLGESSGGACRIGQQWIIFVNLSLTAEEQFQQILVALHEHKLKWEGQTISASLRERLAQVDLADQK